MDDVMLPWSLEEVLSHQPQQNVQTIIECRIHIIQKFLNVPQQPHIVSLFLTCQVNQDVTTMFRHLLIHHLHLMHASHQ